MTKRRIHFGALAAELERDQLASLFVVSGPYERLTDGSKVIVLGNRGAGKTAIIAMLAAQTRDAGGTVVELVPDEFAYELLSQSLAAEEAGSWLKSGAYAAAWKYLIYVLTIKAIIARTPGLKTGAAKRLYLYVRDHHAHVERNPIGALVSYLKRLEGIKMGGIEASVKARELHQLYRLEELDPFLDDIESLARRTPVLVLIDELDRGWDASQDAVAFVAGLFQAATGIAVRTPHVRVVMALRRELYESIPALYEDAQKVRDRIETIDWTEAKLLDLICRRINHSLGELQSSEAVLAWHRVMPKAVARMPSFKYVLDHTLYRPRELIRLCTQVEEVASEHDEDFPFSEDTVLEALALHAAERFEDIVAEYRLQYPGLDSILETFRGQGRRLNRGELELHCLKISLGDLRVSDAATTWTADADVDSLIEVLWRIGFLRCRFPRDPSHDPGPYVGAHQVRTANVRNVEEFEIHSLFATHLGCT